MKKKAGPFETGLQDHPEIQMNFFFLPMSSFVSCSGLAQRATG
jgi:hypothetical protein